MANESLVFTVCACAKFSWHSKHASAIFLVDSCVSFASSSTRTIASVYDNSALMYAASKIGHPGLSLKPEQVAAIQTVYCRKDVFVWLVTGLRKSLCYEAFPFMYDCKLCRIDADSHKSLVLVIAPLIALMVDQVKSLRKRNIRAAIISGGAGGVDEQRGQPC